MPKFNAHCAISEQRTGKRFEDLHKWIDHPPEAEMLGLDHRILRHAYNKKEETLIRKTWGDKAVVEWLFHIAIDNFDTAYKISDGIYGDGTYNFMKIGITTSNFVKVEFDRMNDRDLNININDRRSYW